MKNITTDIKAFYQYANTCRKSRAKIGPLKSGLTFQSGEKEMADILSRQYQSVFTTPSKERYNFKSVVTKIIQDITLTEKQFEDAMRAMKSSSAAGPDGMPAYLFSTFAEELAYPIFQIWRRCLDSGKMPEGPIKATITPIHKGDDKGDPANYRPVFDIT